MGTVTDPSGAVVPSAQVTATEVLTNFSRSVKTNVQGYYVIPSLRPSSYSLTVQTTGFQGYTRQNIVLLTDQTLTVDAQLQVGTPTETITVESTPPQVDTTTGTLRQVVDQARMVELPLNGRNAATLTTLVAGAVVAPANGAIQSSTFGNQAVGGQASAVTVSTNGGMQTAVNYQMDGGDNVDQYTNVNQPFPMPDSLQEFSVQTSDYSAQYGQNSGAIVNVVTKSGTNSLHGGVFEFVRNSVFNSRNWAAASRDQIKRNQFGGTLGGPVYLPGLYNGRDRTFFFGFQATRFRYISTSSQGYVPTPVSLAGDFSAMLVATSPANPLGRAVTIKDPLTGQPFAGNIIPTNRFDPASMAAAKLLPSSDNPNGLIRFTQPFAPQDFHEELVRIDHNISANDRLTSRYFLDNFLNPATYLAGNALTYRDGLPNRSQNLMVQEIHIFNPGLLNDFRFTLSRVNGRQVPPSNSPNYNDLGVKMFQPGAPTPKSIESISVTGLFSFGANAFGAFTRNNFAWYDDVKWVRGRHSVGLGALFQYAQLDVNNNYRRFGAFGFSGDATGYALADFFLGSIRSFTQSSGEFQNDRNRFWNFYIQDSFHATRRLTLNFGVRYEPYRPWDEIMGRIEMFRPEAFLAGQKSSVYVNAPAGLFFPGDPGFPRGGTTGDYNNLAPRFGFAYDLFGDGKTSLRGGVGAFYDSRVISQLTQNTVDVNPFSPSLSLTTPQGPFSDPYRGLASYPPFPFPAPKNFVFPLPISALVFDPSTKFIVPVNYNWNLTVERQLKPDWMLRMAYVGSRGLHIRRDQQLNPVLYTPGAPAPYGNPSLAANSRRLYMPGLTSIGMETQTGSSKYHSLQATLEKRFTHGLTILACYTWSKSLDDLPPNQTLQANGGGGFGMPIYVKGFSRFEYGPSIFDHAQRFVASYVWELPRLAHTSALVRGVLGGWDLTGIVSAQTGNTLTILAGVDRSATNGRDRAVVAGAPYGGDACKGAGLCVTWLDPTSFALPVPAIGTAPDVYAGYPFRFGNAGKGALRGPGMFNADLGLFKGFRLTERFKLQFRAEAFNALNHVNYGDPVSSVNSAGFGSIRGAGEPRIGQLALKLTF